MSFSLQRTSKPFPSIAEALYFLRTGRTSGGENVHPSKKGSVCNKILYSKTHYCAAMYVGEDLIHYETCKREIPMEQVIQFCIIRGISLEEYHE